MDDMMNASFDDLRSHVAPASRSAVMPGAATGSMLTLGGGGGGGFGRSTMPALMSSSGGHSRPHTLVIPDHPQELQVYLCGSGAKAVAGVEVLDARAAATACAGKNDFILFEPLDEAARQGRKLVIVLPRGAPRSELPRAQAYLAESLARWLSEEKTDGAGRPYGEVKDEDPTLRKHYTRAQINAIRAFGHAESGK